MKQMVLTLAFLAVFAGEAQGVWARRIPGTTFTWSFVEGFQYPKYANGQYVTELTVRLCIAHAFEEWLGAVNSEGTRLTCSEETDGSGDMKITFVPLGGETGGGQCDDWHEVELDYEYIFANSDDFETLVLHEMGHAFLGSGHAGEHGVMSQYVVDNKLVHLNLDSWEFNQALVSLFNIPSDP